MTALATFFQPLFSCELSSHYHRCDLGALPAIHWGGWGWPVGSDIWFTPVAQGAQDARGYMPGPPLTGMIYFPDLIELT